MCDAARDHASASNRERPASRRAYPATAEAAAAARAGAERPTETGMARGSAGRGVCTPGSPSTKPVNTAADEPLGPWAANAETLSKSRASVCEPMGKMPSAMAIKMWASETCTRRAVAEAGGGSLGGRSSGCSFGVTRTGGAVACAAGGVTMGSGCSAGGAGATAGAGESSAAGGGSGPKEAPVSTSMCVTQPVEGSVNGVQTGPTRAAAVAPVAAVPDPASALARVAATPAAVRPEVAAAFPPYVLRIGRSAM